MVNIVKAEVSLTDVINSVFGIATTSQALTNTATNSEPSGFWADANLLFQAAAVLSDGVGYVFPAFKAGAILLNLGAEATGEVVAAFDIATLRSAIKMDTATTSDYLAVQSDAYGLISGLFGIIASLSDPVSGAFFTAISVASGLEGFKIGYQITEQNVSKLAPGDVSSITAAIIKAQGALASTINVGEDIFGKSWAPLEASMAAVLGDLGGIIASSPGDSNFITYASNLQTDFGALITQIENLASNSPAATQTVTITSTGTGVSIADGATTISGTASYDAQTGLASSAATVDVASSGTIGPETATSSDVLTPGDTLDGTITATDDYVSGSTDSITFNPSNNLDDQYFVFNGVTIDIGANDDAAFTTDSNGTPALIFYSDNGIDQIFLQADTTNLGTDIIWSNGTTAQDLLDFYPASGQESPQLSIATDSSGTVEVTALLAGNYGAILYNDASLSNIIQNFAFEDPDGLLNIATPSAFYGTISNFQPGDVILLQDVDAATGVSLTAGNLLQVYESSGAVYGFQLDPADNFNNDTFTTEDYDGATGILVDTAAIATGSQSLIIGGPFENPSTNTTLTYSADVNVGQDALTFAPERYGYEYTQTLPVYITFTGGNLNPQDSESFVYVTGGYTSDDDVATEGTEINLSQDTPGGTINLVAYPNNYLDQYQPADTDGETIPLTFDYDGYENTLSIAIDAQLYAPAIPEITVGGLDNSYGDLGIIHTGQTISFELTVTNGATGALTDVLSSTAGTDGVFTAENALTSLAAGQTDIVTITAESDLAGGYAIDESSVLGFTSQDQVLPDQAVSGGTEATVNVYNYAQPVLADLSQAEGLASEGIAGGTLTQDGANYNLDFGTIATSNSLAYLDGVEIENATIGYYDDELDGTVTMSGAGFIATSVPTSFSDLGFIELEPDETTLGPNTLTLTINPESVDSASTTALDPITLTVTDDVVVCYRSGTLILTPSGEKPIESLNIGDEVTTWLSNTQKIKWIGRQTFAPRFVAKNPLLRPIQITAGALGNGLPVRDLFVSAGHSLLLKNTLILARALMNGITITEYTATRPVEYYNFELENHDCIMAEGAWCETYADGPGLRANFHNAAEFWALYPDYQTPETLKLCAPRPESGPDLEAALRHPTARAAGAITPGPLRGFIDILTPEKITGWARDTAHPHLPVKLDVMMGETLITTILACDPRDDLPGRHAFALKIPDPLSAAELTTLKIRRSSDKAELLVTHPQTEAA